MEVSTISGAISGAPTLDLEVLRVMGIYSCLHFYWCCGGIVVFLSVHNNNNNTLHTNLNFNIVQYSVKIMYEIIIL